MLGNGNGILKGSDRAIASIVLSGTACAALGSRHWAPFETVFTLRFFLLSHLAYLDFCLRC
jgi:type IV secretory pathway TrbD component